MPTRTLVTPPLGYPVTVEEAKRHCKMSLESHDEDVLVDGWIASNTLRAEFETGRQLMLATWDIGYDGFPCGAIDVPMPPLVSVVSITYVDTDGVSTVLASSQYQVSAPSGPLAARGRILPAYGLSWPSAREQMGSVVVRIQCGYGASRYAVPQTIRTTILVGVGDMAEHRQSPQRLPGGSATLADDFSWRLAPFRVRPVARQ